MSLTLLVSAAVAGAALASFAVGRWTARREATALPFRAEDCLDAADQAMAEERWGEAATWLERARALAPRSARVAANLAFALDQAGDAEQALHHYEAALLLGAEGETGFHAARTALALGRPPEEAEAWLARALDLDPSLVADLEDDEAFDPLRGRPRFESLLHGAWAALERA